MAGVSSFVSQYLPLAQQASTQTGLPADYILGQAGLETGWGTSNAALSGNNFFGISPGGSLASYDSPEAGFQAYSDLINRRYSGAAGSADPAAYMASNGYSTDPAYASKVGGAVQQVDQVMGTTGSSAAGSPSGTGSWFDSLPSWLQGAIGLQGNANEINPDATGAPGTPQDSTNQGAASGAMSGAGGMLGSLFGGSSTLTQLEELAIRGLVVLVGVLLIAAGFYLAGHEAGAPPSPSKLAENAA